MPKRVCSRNARDVPRSLVPTLALLILVTFSVCARSLATPVAIDSNDIGGVVRSENGPESGVWVIAETQDLHTPYARVVVTDDQGRYVLPDLPDAHYQVWVRGYGLIDSAPVQATRGQALNLVAKVAPTPGAAAEIYPAQYWSALLHPPASTDFPGTGPRGNGIPPEMRTQQHWLVYLQENCMMCHQLGDEVTRNLHPTGGSAVTYWSRRVTKMRSIGDRNLGNLGPVAASLMNLHLGSLGRDRALSMFADWTDRIRNGELPKEVPQRPAGIERNVVVTVWDYGQGAYTRDPVASDRRDPSVNPQGPLYGMATYHGQISMLDPVANTTREIPIPGLGGAAHDQNAQPHHAQMDAKGRVWMAMVSQTGEAPAFCTNGSTESSKYFPYVGGADREWSGGQENAHRKAQPLVMYDPSIRKVTVLPLCSGGNHISIGWDADSTAYLSGDANVVSWFKTKVWDDTHDITKAHGWCPMVLDTNGDGRITPDRRRWNTSGKALDPTKDTEIERFLYGINVGEDGIVWAAGYLPLMPSGLVRLDPGKHPPETCVTEIYEPPMKDGGYDAYGLRGVASDSQGIAWATFASGHIGAFDRRKCKVTRGPRSTGAHCPEGWTIYEVPGPKLSGTQNPANIAYGAPVDFGNVFGMGADTVFFPTMNADAILALDRKTDRFQLFRVPFPRGFYSRDLQFRVNDPKAGWKGRAIYGGYTQFAIWHQEERGVFSKTASKVASFQLRPDPLAH